MNCLIRSISRRRVLSSSCSNIYCFSSQSSEREDLTATTTNSPHQPSNRQKFRSIPIPPSTLGYIRKIGVGRDTPGGAGGRRRRRRTLEGGGSETAPSEAARRPPPPFGPGSRVRVTASCTSAEDFPPPQRRRGGSNGSNTGPPVVPEVALVGRSNVGCVRCACVFRRVSSAHVHLFENACSPFFVRLLSVRRAFSKSTLLNALLYGNKRSQGLGKGSDKAEVSDRPGETRAVTFYHLSSSSSSSEQRARSLRLVDLPGYGFAHGPPGDFQSLTTDYLLHRNGGSTALKRVLLLLDARHGLKASDADFLRRWQVLLQQQGEMGRCSLPPLQAVLTKCDLVTQVDLARQMVLVRQRLSDCLVREPSHLPVLCVSARTGLLRERPRQGAGDNAPRFPRGGLLELQRELAALVVLPDPLAASRQIKRDLTGRPTGIVQTRRPAKPSRSEGSGKLSQRKKVNAS